MADQKKRTIYAYEIRLALRNSTSTVKVVWDSKKFERILDSLSNMQPQIKAHRKQNEWVMYLDELDFNNDYFWGYFISTRYGTKSDRLIHGTNLSTRPNPRDLMEGEEIRTHFLIRKSDGLLLMEAGFQDVVTRAKVSEYIDEVAKNILAQENVAYSLVNMLLGVEFFEAIEKLDKIKSAQIEIYTKKASGLNPVFQTLLNEAEEVEANLFQIALKGRRKSLPFTKVSTWIKKNINQNGIASVKVVGDEANQVDKVINLKRNAEKYKSLVELDDLGQVKSASIYDKMLEIASSRPQLPREEKVVEQRAIDEVEVDE